MLHEFDEDNNFTDDMPFGEYIRKKRRLMGYNQSDFAELLDINTGTVSQWELGVTSPQIEKARRIVEILGGRILIRNDAEKGNEYEEIYKGNDNHVVGGTYGKIRSRSVQRASGDLVQLEHDKGGGAY